MSSQAQHAHHYTPSLPASPPPRLSVAPASTLCSPTAPVSHPTRNLQEITFLTSKHIQDLPALRHACCFTLVQGTSILAPRSPSSARGSEQALKNRKPGVPGWLSQSRVWLLILWS